MMKPEGVSMNAGENIASGNVDMTGNEHSMVYVRRVERKQYELTDHLGNVRVVIKDVKTTDVVQNNKPHGPYEATLLASNNYYPFGMLQPERHWSTGEYRYGYNGKEMDNEIKDEGNSYDYGARMYDSRVARWLSRDPLEKKYPSWASYSAFADNPILFYDPDGKVVRNGNDTEDPKQNQYKDRTAALIADVLPDEMKYLQNLQMLADAVTLVSPSDGAKVGTPVFINIEISDIDKKGNAEKMSDYNKARAKANEKMITISSGYSHLDGYAHVYWMTSDNVLKSGEGIIIDGVLRSWESFSTDEEAIEALAKYGNVGLDPSKPIEIFLDDVTSGSQPERMNLAHEVGAVIKEVQNLPAYVYYSKYKLNKNGTRGDSNSGHEFEENPHNVGAHEGEKKEAERMARGE